MTSRLTISSPSSNGFAEQDAATFLNTVDGTVPPSSFIVEQNCVASILVNPDSLPTVRAIMPDMMAIRDPQLRAMFHAVCWMADSDQYVDLSSFDEVLVQSAMTRLGYETTYKTSDALREMRVLGDAENAGLYAAEVQGLYMRRQVMDAAVVAYASAANLTHDISATMTSLTRKVEGFADSRATGRTFAGLDAGELETYSTQEPDWLVRDLFTSDEPLLVGARSKGCKTLQLVDLTVALASGTPWMGTFEVPKRRKVLFISGETNNRRMSRHIERACRSRGLSFSDLAGMVRVEAVNFPNLPSPDDLRSIERTVKRHGIGVVILDPLYRGMAGVDAAQLSEMGSAIKNFQAACSPATLILSHHVIKSAAREYGTPPSLEDMTGAGLAESCGQWWLVGRNEKYAWDGMHDLCVSYGGREGQAGGKRIVFNERAWTFDVENLSDFIADADDERQRQQDAKKNETDTRKRNQARVRILAACRNIKTPQARTRIRDASGQSGVTFGAAFGELVSELQLLARPYKDSRNHIVPEGYILAEYAHDYDQTWKGI